MSGILRTQRQNGLPGLSKVWKPIPLAWNHREVTRKGVIKVKDVFPAGKVRNGGAGNSSGDIY